MNQPLGNAIGNALEVRECIDILSGRTRPNDLVEVTLALAAEMLAMAGIADGRAQLEKRLASGAALEKFNQMVAAQGGDARRLPVAKFQKPIRATTAGYVQAIACDQLGYAVIALGGGRAAVHDAIDFAVGFEHPKKLGERVEAGEPLLLMHYNDADRAAIAERLVQQAYDVRADIPAGAEPAFITERIA